MVKRLVKFYLTQTKSKSLLIRLLYSAALPMAFMSVLPKDLQTIISRIMAFIGAILLLDMATGRHLYKIIIGIRNFFKKK